MSRMESYSRCPEAFRRSYIEGEKKPPAVAMIKGSAFHQGAETNFSQKIESHTDLPAADIIAAAAADFDARSQNDLYLDEDQRSRGKTVVVGEAMDSVVRMAEAHAVSQAPDYQPTFVEVRTEIELPSSSVNLVGVIDLVDDQRRVIDFKTAARKKSQADADDSLQLTVYAAAYHALTGEPSAGQRLDCVVETKKSVSRQAIDTTRTAADYRALAARITAIQAAIDAGNFPPTSSTNWWCSKRWCGYFEDCPFTEGRRGRQND